MDTLEDFATKNPGLEPADTLRRYSQHTKLELLKSGEWDDQLVNDIDEELAGFGAENGLDPKAIFERPEEDDLRLTTQVMLDKDPAIADAARSYFVAQSDEARAKFADPKLYDENLALHKKTYEDLITPEKRNLVKREAMRSGDLPFAMVDGALEFSPMMRDVVGNDEALAKMFDAYPNLDPSLLPAVKQQLTTAPGYAVPRFELNRQSDLFGTLQSVMGKDPDIAERVGNLVKSYERNADKGTVHQMLGGAKGVNSDPTLDTVAQLLENQGLGGDFSRDEIKQYVNDFALAASSPQLQEGDVDANVTKLSTGQAVLPMGVLLNKQLFDQTMKESKTIPAEQKDALMKSREARVSSYAPDAFKIIADNRPEFARFLTEKKEAGATNAAILDEWMSNPENHSSFRDYAGGIGESLVEGFGGLVLYPAALAGSDSARDAIAGLQKSDSDRRAYARLFGKNLSAGYDLSRLIAPVAADIGMVMVTGGAAAPMIAGKSSVKTAIKNTLRTALTSETKGALAGFTKAAAVRAGGSGTMAIDDVLTLAGKDIAGKLTQSVNVASFLTTAGVRSGGSTYVQLHTQLSDQKNADGSKKYSPEQVREIALNHGLIAAVTTMAVTGGFSMFGHAGMEGIYNGITRKQLGGIYDRMGKSWASLSPAVKAGISMESPEKMLESIMRKSLGTIWGRGADAVISEGAEEGIDQILGYVNQQIATGDKIDVGAAIREGAYAAMLGGVMGGTVTGVNSVVRGRSVAPDMERMVLLDTAMKLDAAKSPQTAAVLRKFAQQLNVTIDGAPVSTEAPDLPPPAGFTAETPTLETPEAGQETISEPLPNDEPNTQDPAGGTNAAQALQLPEVPAIAPTPTDAGTVGGDTEAARPAEAEVQGEVTRDATKPEQMTPAEYLTPRIAALETEIAELEANQPPASSNAYLYWQPKLVEAKRNLQALKEDRDEPGTGKPWMPGLQQRSIFEALESTQPVSAEAVDTYGIKLPDGYVREGELYVYRPNETPTQDPAPQDVGPELPFPNADGETETLTPEEQKLVNRFEELSYKESQSKLPRGKKLTKAEQKELTALAPQVRPLIMETVDPENDPVVGVDINGTDIRQSKKGTYYTIENGRIRTGPAFSEETPAPEVANDPLPESAGTPEAPVSETRAPLPETAGTRRVTFTHLGVTETGTITDAAPNAKGQVQIDVPRLKSKIRKLPGELTPVKAEAPSSEIKKPRFKMGPSGIVFDDVNKISVAPPAMSPEKQEALLSALQNSVYANHTLPIGIGRDAQGRDIITSAATDVPSIVFWDNGPVSPTADEIDTDDIFNGPTPDAWGISPEWDAAATLAGTEYDNLFKTELAKANAGDEVAAQQVWEMRNNPTRSRAVYQRAKADEITSGKAPQDTLTARGIITEGLHPQLAAMLSQTAPGGNGQHRKALANHDTSSPATLLASLAKSGPDKFKPLARLLQQFDWSGVTLTLVDDNIPIPSDNAAANVGGNIGGVWIPETRQILLMPDSANVGTIETALHEMVHAATEQSLKNPNSEQAKVVKRIEGYIKNIKKTHSAEVKKQTEILEKLKSGQTNATGDSRSPEEVEAYALKNIMLLEPEAREKALNNLGEGTPKQPGFLRIQRTLDELDSRASEMSPNEWRDNIYFNSPINMMRWSYVEHRPLTKQEARILNGLREAILKREYAPVTGKKISDKDWPEVKGGDLPTTMQAENLTGNYNEGRDYRPDFAQWGVKRVSQHTSPPVSPLSPDTASKIAAAEAALARLNVVGYGVSDNYEFLAHMLTSEQFRTSLEMLPKGDGKSFVQLLFDAIADLLLGKKKIPGVNGDIIADLVTFVKAGDPVLGVVQSRDARFMYAGEKATKPQFMQDSLETARTMAAAGKTSEEIRTVTGWFPGKYDGKMRWEIPDAGAKLKKDFGKATKVSDLLDHPMLFSAYPAIAESPVEFRGFTAGISIEGVLVLPSMTARFGTDNQALLEGVLHEIQHLIQDTEGFAKGGNPDMVYDSEKARISQKKAQLEKIRDEAKVAWDATRSDTNLAAWKASVDAVWDVMGEKPVKLSSENELAYYRRIAGEIEARDVQARAKFTPEQLKAIAPYSSENIAAEDAIVRFRPAESTNNENGTQRSRETNQSGGTPGAETSRTLSQRNAAIPPGSASTDGKGGVRGGRNADALGDVSMSPKLLGGTGESVRTTTGSVPLYHGSSSEFAKSIAPAGTDLSNLDFDQIREELTDVRPLVAEDIMHALVNREIAHAAGMKAVGGDTPRLRSVLDNTTTGNPSNADRAHFIVNPEQRPALVSYLKGAANAIWDRLKERFDTRSAVYVDRLVAEVARAESGYRITDGVARFMPAMPDKTRFTKLTKDLPAKPTAADLDAWRASHPDEYRELKEMRERVLRGAGYDVGPVWRGEQGGDRPDTYPRSMRREPGIFTTDEKAVADGYDGDGESREFLLRGPVLDLRGDDQYELSREGKTFVNRWAEEGEWDFEERRSGEEVTPAEAVASGELFDWEGNWSSARWKDLQATAFAEGFNTVILKDKSGDAETGYMDSYVAKDSESLKTTEPLNLDANGKLITPDQWGDTTSPDIRFMPAMPSRGDAEYLAAVEVGDMETAQRMVDEAAKAAGMTPLWRQGRREGKWWSESKNYAHSFGKLGREVHQGYLSDKIKIIDEEQLRRTHVNITKANSADEELRLWDLALKDTGSDGVRRLEESMDGPSSWSIYIVNPSQIKSADPVTRDSDGNVVPLSQRFNTTSPDTRFMPAMPPTDADGNLTFSHTNFIFANDGNKLYTATDKDINEKPGWLTRMFARGDDMRKSLSAIKKGHTFRMNTMETKYDRLNRDYARALKKEGTDEVMTKVREAGGDNRPMLTPEAEERVNSKLKERLEAGDDVNEAQELAYQEAKVEMAKEADLRRERSSNAMEWLEGNAPLFHKWAKEMRDTTDEFQTQLHQILINDRPEMAWIVDNSRGVYLTRTWRIHQDPAYAEMVLHDPKMADKRDALIEVFTKDLVETEIKKLAKDPQFANVNEADLEVIARKSQELQEKAKARFQDLVMGHEYDDSSLPSTGLKTEYQRLLRKKNLDEAIEDILGRIDDPQFNANRTMQAVSGLIFNQKLLTAIKTEGLESGTIVDAKEFASDPMKYKGWKPLVSANVHSSSYAPLAGYYAPEADVVALNAAFGFERNNVTDTGKRAMKTVDKMILAASNWSLVTMTLGSVGYFSRGLSSSPFFMIPQGVSPFSKNFLKSVQASYGAAFATDGGGSKNPILKWLSSGEVTIEFREKMVALGILKDGVHIGFLRDLREQYTKDPLGVPDWIIEKGMTIDPKIIAGLKKGGELAKGALNQLERLADFTENTANVAIFLTKLQVLLDAKAYDTIEECEQEAARITKAVAPSKSERPQALKEFQKQSWSALIAPFAGFRADMLRITVNTYREAAKMAKSDNPVLRKHGKWCLFTAATMHAGVTVTVPLLLQAILGFDDEEDKALRAGMPAYSRGSQFWMWSNGNGSIRMMDLTFTNPWSFSLDMIPQLIRSWRDPLEMPEIIAKYVGGEMIGENIVAGSLLDVARNHDEQRGGSIWFETDDFSTKITKAMKHVGYSSYTPQIAKKIEQIIRATSRPDKADEDFYYTPFGIAVGMAMPTKPMDRKVEDTAFRAFRELGRANRELSYITGELTSKAGLGEGKAAELYNERMRATVKVAKKAHELAKAYQSMGLTRQQVMKAMTDPKGGGFSKERAPLYIKGFAEKYVLPVDKLREIQKIDPRRYAEVVAAMRKHGRYIDVR